MTISSLRYPRVPDEEEIREYFINRGRSLEGLVDAHAATGRDTLFSYLHLEDTARIAQKAIEADFDGHETFWAVAADTSADVPSADLIEEYFPRAEVQTEFSDYETFVSISKAAALLDWRPQRSWRDNR